MTEEMRARLTFLFRILLALASALALIAILMNPPWEDLRQLAMLLGLTALGSLAIGSLAHQLGWWRRMGSLSLSLTLGYALAAGLTLLNVWVTARLMFISEHDLALGSILLLFAGAISVAFGASLSANVAGAVDKLVTAARRLSEGDFGVRVRVTGRDELARLSDSFNAMAERLEQADKDARRLEAARRDLVAWVSHDLRTPLSALQAMTDAMVDGVVTDPQEVKRYLNQCQAAIRRMNDLIDDLFQLAQVDAGHLHLQFEPCNLSDLVSDAIGGFSANVQAKDVSITGEVDPGLDPVWIAPREISRVLHNLLENALRHTPAGGIIHVQGCLEDDVAHLSIQDSGEGIDPKDLPRIFERFYRSEKSRSRDGFQRGGAGLGLAIAKGFIEAHGGEIWAESTLGEGTTMHFELPLVQEEGLRKEVP
jgi:signal transduction histidine kinase